jgi:hypothetical protein
MEIRPRRPIRVVSYTHSSHSHNATTNRADINIKIKKLQRAPPRSAGSPPHQQSHHRQSRQHHSPNSQHYQVHYAHRHHPNSKLRGLTAVAPEFANDEYCFVIPLHCTRPLCYSAIHMCCYVQYLSIPHASPVICIHQLSLPICCIMLKWEIRPGYELRVGET